MSAFEPILKERYEVIVIGAGIGGLSAASVLACEGLEVLLLEQARQPGGCCSSFRIGDFTFDSAATIIQGFGEFGFHALRTLFDFTGQQVELIGLDSAYSMYFGDRKIDFFLDRHAFEAELGALFPREAGGILSFIRELNHLYHAFLDCSGPLRPPGDEPALQRLSMLARHPMSLLRLSRYQHQSAARILGRHVEDPLAHALFDADLSYCTGYGISELSAPHAALSIIERHTGNTHYPIGSSQQIPDRLEKTLVEHGGRVAYRLAVEEVLVEDGRAVGVRLSNGRNVYAEAVISDTCARNLFGRLLGREHLRPQTIEWVGSLEPAPEVMAVFLGVDGSVVPEDFHPVTVIVDDPLHRPDRYVAINIPSILDPNLAPEGRHSITIHAVTDPGMWPSPGDPAYGSDEYLHLKESEAEKVLGLAEQLLPGLSAAVLERSAASPATYERYTRRERGAVAGPLAPGLAPANLPGAVTEIPGLFLVGDSTFFGRGVPQAAASGINGALAAIRHFGLKPPRFHPVRESSVMETIPVRPQISGEEVVDTISAVLESHRCLKCEDAPCVSGCPAGVDIPTFIRRVSAADFAGSARVIRDSTPLGEVCGTVCPVDRLCQGRCRRSEIDSAVRIGQLEALVCNCASGEEGWPVPFPGERLVRVAVVGSGPAGVSCAYFLSLLGYSVEIFEAGIEAGGLPARAMPRFRLGHQALLRDIEGALRTGIEFRGNTSFGEDVNFESLSREGFRAVFIGAGLGTIKTREVRGADLPGVIDALSFLGAARRSVKRELTSRVAVLGDTDMAVDTARLARELGATNVFLVTEKPEGGLQASPGTVLAARGAGIEFMTGWTVMEIVGKGRVEGVRTRTTDGGARVSTNGNGEAHVKVIDVETVIVAGDRESEASLAQYLAGHLKLGPDGTVLVDPRTLETSRRGVFAGGDLTGGSLVVSACAQGRKAALEIDRYLRSAPGESRPVPGEASSSSL